MTRAPRLLLALTLVLTAPSVGRADFMDIIRCQGAFAREGARFAKRILDSTLRCTIGITECQVQCDQGVFGPSCDDSPPPCCDSDDTDSNAAFASCMSSAQSKCDVETQKQAGYEDSKVKNITLHCNEVLPDELCGAQAEGLNFGVLNAGCLALNPNYTCSLDNLISCVGGPLEHALLDQVSAVLHPRAGDSIAAIHRESAFPDLPITRKVKEDLPAGKVDVWSFAGKAGDQIIVKVRTGDDTGTGQSTLHPDLVLLDSDGTTPIADTTLNAVPCSVPNTCGSTCPLFRRTLPYTRTYFMAVHAIGGGSCTGGKYRLVVISPGGVVPNLVADDATP